MMLINEGSRYQQAHSVGGDEFLLRNSLFHAGGDYSICVEPEVG